MNDNSKETNPNDINVLVNESFVINFLEPPANTSATRKITEYREVDVSRFDEKECYEKALEIKELFERQDQDATLQELTRQLKDKEERKSLSKLKKYLYNRKKRRSKTKLCFCLF